MSPIVPVMPKKDKSVLHGYPAAIKYGTASAHPVISGFHILAYSAAASSLSIKIGIDPQGILP